MTGLRARHKADRRERILQAATTLFRSVGYEAARIEAIARDADVAIGTIYNYYQNKGDILMAIVSLEVGEVLAAGRAVIEAPPAHVGRAVDALLTIYVDHSLVYLSKDMWRQAMAISIQQPNSPFGSAYTALDRALSRQTCALLTRLEALGTLKPDVDCRGVGEMIFNNVNMMFMEFVKDEAMSDARLRAALRRQNRTLISAISADPAGVGDR